MIKFFLFTIYWFRIQENSFGKAIC